jgi:DnaJ-domain-containing protein 1
MFSGNGKTIEVSVRMLDGATLRGSLVQNQTQGQNQSIEGILGRDAPFLEFVSKEGQRKFLAKHQIAYVEPVEPLRKPVLTQLNDPRFMDAFTMLGVERGCSFEAAKDAYHRLAKLYHPDNYGGKELPPEVARYLTDMFRQINTAFTEVRAELQNAA